MDNGTTQDTQNGTTEATHDTQNGTTEEAQNGTTDETQDGTTDETQDGTTDETQDGATNETLDGTADKTQDGTTDETQDGTTEDTQQARSSQEAMTDYDLCTKFFEHTCSCKKNKGKPCSSLFPLEHYVDMRAQAAAMTNQELDLVLLGLIMTTIHDHDETVVRGRHKPAKRKSFITLYAQ